MSNNYENYMNYDYETYLNKLANYENHFINRNKTELSVEDKLNFLINKDKPIYNKLSEIEEKQIIDYYSTDNLYNNDYNIDLLKIYENENKLDNLYKDVEMKDNYLNMEITEDMIPLDVGLINTGNSCYINSVLQIFLHNKILYRKLYNWLYNNEKETPISKKIYDILIFLKQLFTKERGYYINNQCDSEEFLTWLLDKINCDKLFNIDWEHKLICNGCNNTKNFDVKELMWNIKIDENTLQEYNGDTINIIRLIVRQNYNKQLIDYKCDKCESTKAIKIEKPIDGSRHLIFNINTPKTKLKFYDYLDIFKDSDYEYELYGMIIHIGPNNSYGHYVFYYFYDDNDNDYENDDSICFNDTKVSVVKKDRLLNGDLEKDETIRLLWYKRIKKEDIAIEA
jgi:uncharacterized UBP type Zn finger protein